MTLAKAGAIAALVEAAAYAIGFAVLFAVLSPGSNPDATPAEALSTLLAQKTMLSWWYLIIYVVFGVALVVLVSALHEHLRAARNPTLPIGSAFGLIWAGLVIASGMVANVGLDAVAGLHDQDPAQALTLWQHITTLQDALGGGVELVGGLWVLLVSVVALRGEALPRFLNVLGLLVGACGIATALPGLGDLGAVFGLGQLPWFLWLGVHLLTREPEPPSAAELADGDPS